MNIAVIVTRTLVRAGSLEALQTHVKTVFVFLSYVNCVLSILPVLRNILCTHLCRSSFLRDALQRLPASEGMERLVPFVKN